MKIARIVGAIVVLALISPIQMGHAGAASEKLKFLGEGTFRYLGMKLYSARFYLDAQAAIPNQVLSDTSKKLVIHYLRDIPKDALIRAAEKNLRNNPRVNFMNLKARMDQLHQHYTNLKKGDVYELSYSDGETKLFYNGFLKTQIEGADFAQAYFGIWVSDHSISKKLTNDLLGGNH